MATNAVSATQAEERKHVDPALLRRGSLEGLTQRLKAIHDSTKDIVVDSRAIVAEATPQSVRLHVPGDGNYPYEMSAHAKSQVAEKLGFPLRYWHACEQAGAYELVATNVNHWLQHSTEPRLVRTAEGRVRAFLSNSFRALDNYDLAYTIADRAQAHHAQVLQCDLTESRMAIRLVTPEHRTDVTPGDTVIPGLLVTNSDVGAAAFRVEAFVWRVICQNGLISEKAFSQIHLGAKLELGEVQWRDDTRMAEDSATWRKVRDVVDATFAGTGKFGELVGQLRGATEIPIAKPIEVTDTVAKNLELSEDRRAALLRYFAKEGDTVYGLIQGVTRLAQDSEDPVEQMDLERYAGTILAKPAEVLALAA